MKTQFRFALLILGFGILSATGCGRDSDFIYRLPSKEPDVHLNVNVKEIKNGGMVDVLWIIDNSGSMSGHQANVIKNSGLFMQDFISQQVGWKMGLISTDEYAKPFLGFDIPFDSSIPNPVQVFSSAVSTLGTSGSGTEKTFTPILNHLTNFPNFLRPNVPLAILIITDAREQSYIDAPTFLNNFKTIIGNRDFFVYPVLAAQDLSMGSYCSPDDSNYNYHGGPYEAFANAAKVSKAFSLCSPDFGQNLAKIGNQITQQILRSEIKLSKRPKLRTLQISYNGRILPSGQKSRGGIWYYDYDRNSVSFYNLDFAQGNNENVDITFEEDDGLP